ncbi:hypothetical protein Trydic_g23370 [Trypoxylus dichotomus]
MSNTTESHSVCEVRLDIPFFECEECKLAEIHRQIYKDSMVRRWSIQLNEGLESALCKERGGHPSLVTDALVRDIEGEI